MLPETILEKVNLWLLESFEREYLWISNKISKISEWIRQCVENILWPQNKELSDLLINLEAIWCIELSENPINHFPVETEIKVLNVNHESIIAKMEQLWYQKTFSWEVDDIYFDFPDLWLDKQDLSFRIRKKTYTDWTIKFFYTIKRKDSDKRNECWLRYSHERELFVPKPTMLLALIKDKWLRASRRKTKKRVSYLIPWINIKFDLDEYVWTKIPPLIEVEIDEVHKELLPTIYDALWIKGKEITSEWSRALYKRYWEEQTKFYSRVWSQITWKNDWLQVKKTTKPIKK